MAAEAAVLGAMLLSKDAIADVVESLKVEDLPPGARDGVLGDPGPVRGG